MNAVTMVKNAVSEGGGFSRHKAGTLKASEWSEAIARLRADGYIIVEEEVTVLAPGRQDLLPAARE